jgi:hypothetical protein
MAAVTSKEVCCQPKQEENTSSKQIQVDTQETHTNSVSAKPLLTNAIGRSVAPSICAENDTSMASSSHSSTRSASPTEEEIQWITISRKQTKQKSTATIALANRTVQTSVPSNNQKRTREPEVMSMSSKTASTKKHLALAQQTVINTKVNSEIRTNSSNKSQQNMNVSSTCLRNPSDSNLLNTSPQHKSQPPSCWTMNTSREHGIGKPVFCCTLSE